MQAKFEKLVQVDIIVNNHSHVLDDQKKRLLLTKQPREILDRK